MKDGKEGIRIDMEGVSEIQKKALHALFSSISGLLHPGFSGYLQIIFLTLQG